MKKVMVMAPSCRTGILHYIRQSGPSANATNLALQVPINPKEKSFQRFLKRHAAKVEVYQKGGFLRSDTLLGTAKVELAQLEGRCTVHDR